MYEKLIQKIETDKVANKRPLAVRAPVIRNQTVKIEAIPSNVSVITEEDNSAPSTLVDKAEKIKNLSMKIKKSRRSSEPKREIVELW